MPLRTSSMPPNAGPTDGLGSTTPVRAPSKNNLSSSCSSSATLFFRLMTRPEYALRRDTDDNLPKLKPESRRDEDAGLDDSGDIGDEEMEEVGDLEEASGRSKAARRRRREWRGWSGRKAAEGMVYGEEFSRRCDARMRRDVQSMSPVFSLVTPQAIMRCEISNQSRRRSSCREPSTTVPWPANIPKARARCSHPAE
ncbi:hypothetical protein EJ03DRAFT_24497 [Teratosphaeria nubilosa]|uniref:Uncharacterized protein n=1 Tax=Teratosphaeria nubilosa TaxID=161662 RepID=A0A6G1LGN6_9PEZI|nr:hypothetical protein EJ03DRAFT_24497 [Teratosphaeria nubilosa]